MPDFFYELLQVFTFFYILVVTFFTMFLTFLHYIFPLFINQNKNRPLGYTYADERYVRLILGVVNISIYFMNNVIYYSQLRLITENIEFIWSWNVLSFFMASSIIWFCFQNVVKRKQKLYGQLNRTSWFIHFIESVPATTNCPESEKA